MASADRPARRSNVASALTLARINLRRIRFDGAATLVLAGVVLLTAFSAVAAPRFFNQVSDDALRTFVRDAAPINRNISIERGMRIQPQSGNTFAGVGVEGDALRDEFSAPVQQIIGDQRYVVDTLNFELDDMPGETSNAFPRFLRLRYQEDVENQVTLVSGALPAQADPLEVTFTAEAGPQTLPVYEVAITAESAALLMLGIGDTAILTPLREDTLNQGVTLNELRYNLVVRVSGIIEIDEPDVEYWFGDRRLHEPFVVENPDFVEIYGMGLFSPDAYQALLDDTSPSLWSYNWRYFVEPARFDAGDLDQITEDLRALELQFGAGGLTRVNEPRLRTGLVRIADRYESQRQLTISMLSLVVAGMIVVAIAVAALLGALIATRRRDSALLSRSRGASSAQLGWSQGIESVAVFTPAALLGLGAALLIITGRTPGYVVALAISVAVLVAGIVVALSLPINRGDLGQLLSETAPGQRRSRHRIVIESVVVLAAVGGLVLFRRRGLEAGSLSNPDQGFDPFLTAVPVLLALAIGVILLRLYPLPVRLASWFGSLRRGAVIFVGFRRIVQQPLAARLPLVVMLVATGIAVFAAVVRYSITEGQQNSTWQEVGADFRIESVREDAPISSLVDLSGVSGIQAAADAARLQGRDVSSTAARGTFTLLAIDPADYQEVAGGTRADPEFPDSMLVDQSVQGIGTAANPLPAIVSHNWGTSAPPDIGDTLNIEVRRTTFTVVVRGFRENFPSLIPGEQFVVVPRASVEAVDPTLDTRGTYRYIKAPPAMDEELRSTLRSQALSAQLVSRPRLFEDLADAPLVDGVENAFRATVILATLYAVLAALAGIALTSRERARDLGYLRTLGLTSRQATILTVIEQLPPAILATVAGAGLGFALVWLIEPGLDLSTFAGATLPADVLIDARVLALVAGAELLTILVAIAVYSYLTRRLNLGNVLRLGDRT